MSAGEWTLLGSLACLVVLGMPFAFAIGISVVLGLWVSGIDLIVAVQQLMAGVGIFTLLAVPCFILAGDLMHTGGLSRRLVDIAMLIVGRVRGGLAMVAILSATFFGAISGSAPATTAAIGKLMTPEMIRQGYSKPFSAALSAAYGPIGILIPPSIPIVIWAVIANESITDLFIAGIVPGLLLGLGLMAASYVYARRIGLAVETVRPSWREVLSVLNRGKWALLAPVLILGGIYGGVFTPTEAGAVGVAYGLVVGLLLHREMRLADVPAIILRSMSTTAMVIYIVGMSVGFGWLVGLNGLPNRLGEMTMGISPNPIVILLLINVLLLLVGALMDTIAAMIILSTFLIHVGQALQLDPVHYGAMIVMNLGIGMATPPFGYTLFTAAATTETPIAQIIPPLLLLILVEIAALLIIAYVPAASTMLVDLL